MVLPAFILSTLEIIGKSVAGTVLSKLTSKAFDSILGPDEKDPQLVTDPVVRAELQEIISELGALYDRVAKLGREVESFKLDIKRDKIQVWVDSINTLSDEYWTIVQQLTICATGGADPENMTKYKQARKRSCELGERIKIELYAYTVHIDSFIAGTQGESLFALVNKQYQEDCDFYSYFCRMRSELFYYWTVQFKATVLMQMVAQDPVVGFVNSQALVDRVKQRLDAQENYVKSLIPDSAAKLAMSFAKDESGKAPLTITLKSHKGRWIHGGASPTDQVCYIDPTPASCKIEPVQSCAVPQRNQDYYFYFCSNFARMSVNVLADNPKLLLTFGPHDPEKYFDAWKIQVSTEGEFTLKPLRLKEPMFSNVKKFMAQSWYGEAGTTLIEMDPGNPDLWFAIELLS